jgi:hypothetical protein
MLSGVLSNKYVTPGESGFPGRTHPRPTCAFAYDSTWSWVIPSLKYDDRGTVLTKYPLSPGALYLFDRIPDSHPMVIAT